MDLEIDLSNLKKLQDPTKDEYTELVALDKSAGGDLARIIAGRLAAEKQQALMEAADDIVKLLRHRKIFTESLVQQIRDARKAIDARKSTLKALERAQAYGVATMNWLPLAKLLATTTIVDEMKQDSASYSGAEYEVPEDWQPPAPATEKF